MNLSNIITKIEDVPQGWIFQHYLRKVGRPLSVPLDGRVVRMKSIFTPGDRVPSMYLLFNQEKRKYIYYDHSSNRKGDAIDLVKIILDTASFRNACNHIIDEYQKYVDEGHTYIDSSVEYSINLKPVYSASVKTKQFEKKETDFLNEFSINSSVLQYYNVTPLSSYILTKKEGDVYKEVMEQSNQLMFGFFDNFGELQKIYQPYNDYAKYLTFNSFYYHGFDQLQYQSDFLVLMSGAKDMWCASSLDGLDVEFMAPASENDILPEPLIKNLKSYYKYVFTLFDNDTAGKTAMVEYKKRYNIPYITLKSCHEQDFAKNIQKHNTLKVYSEFIAEISKKTDEYEVY
jgi:hypothetical protein